jgi:hypothetical protein
LLVAKYQNTIPDDKFNNLNEERKNLGRRDFLKLSASTAALSVMPFKKDAFVVGSSATTNEIPPDPEKLLRHTIAMWDFSWLTAHHRGGAYEHLQQRVAEAAERGFNTIRIDCFPSRILEGKSIFKKNYTPGKGLPFWGQTAMDHEEPVLAKLVLLANACRKYNIRLGLDSWEKGHMIHKDNVNPLVISNVIQPTEEEQTFRFFSDTWVKALKQMREEGVLERAAWVSPMNEVPHFGSRSVQFFKNISAAGKNEGETKLETDTRINKKYRQINQWLGEAIKNEVAKDKVALCYSSLGAEEYFKRVTDIYDMIDVHFMPDVIMDQDQKAALKKMEKGGSGFHYFENMDSLKNYSSLWDRSCRLNYAAMLSRARNYFTTALNNVTATGGKKMQAIVTESYGPCFWPDDKNVSWNWYKKYNSDALRIAAAMPFTGLSLSNYSEPLFSLWDDLDWHRNSNLFTLTMSPV